MKESSETPLSGGRSATGRGILLILAGTVTGSTVPVVSKAVMETVPSIHFSTLWMALSLFYTSLLMARTGLRRSAGALVPHWKLLLPCGIAASVWVFFAFQGLARLDPTVATFIINSRMVWAVAVGFLFLGERYAPVEVIGIATIAVGVVLVFWEERRIGDVTGALFMVVSSIGYVVTSLFAKRLVARSGVLAALVARFLFPLLAFIPLSVARGGFFDVMTWRIVLLMVGGAFVGPFLSFNLMYSALRYLHLGVQTVFQSVSVVMTGILSFLALGAIPTSNALIGGGVLIAGMVVLGVGAVGKSSRRSTAAG
jgi:drug/metabolite transporter (DMT)-like permease